MKKLLIFDASNYMFRAFFASPPMSNSVGFPTNALHFYTTMILSVIRRVSPDVIALAHEYRGPKFRHELYPDYKGQREAPPEALQHQFPWFRKITDALGIKAYSAEKYEADDIIATLTRQGREAGYHVIIASSDKDLMQLIERTDDVDTVVMLDAMAKAGSKNGHAITIDHVFERFQVAPDKVADVLALAGDTVDNIPGCKGIGEKTAGKLIAQYGSLEELMRRVDEIKKPAQHANLVAFAPNAELSKKLTSLVYDVPVTLEETALNPDPKTVTELFSALELHKLLTDVLGADAKPDKTVPRIQIPSDEENAAVSNANASENEKTDNTKPQIPANALDITVSEAKTIRPFVETSICNDIAELDAFKSSKIVALTPLWIDESMTNRQLLGYAIADATRAIYVPVRHGRSLFGTAVSPTDAESFFKNILTNAEITKAVNGLKPIVQYARAQNIDIDIAQYFDTEHAAYIVHPEQTNQTFNVCAQKYLGESLDITPENWLGTGKKAVLPTSFSANDAGRIAGKWAQITLQLAEKLPAEIDAHDLKKPYHELDMPLLKILADMEFCGIKLDLPALRALSKSFDETLERLNTEAHAFSDDNFNINSPKDLARFLFEVLKLVPATKKTRSHGLSTDQDTLESIDHPIAQIILDYRAISKLRSTYSETLANQANPETHRIHGKFNANVTATTRLSSSDPNLQNIPARTELGRQIKRAFIPEEGHTFISADYSQIELRMMAAFSKEPVLCDAYHRGEDIHARTAASLFAIPFEDVTKAQRQLAKTINFGLLYGMGVQKLARETGYSKAEAKKFLEKFHEQFPTLSTFFTQQVETAKAHGETRTIFGHRRPMPDLFSAKPMLRAAGERIALNTPIQGSASDIVKAAMIRLDKALRDNGLHGRLLIQVHDELLIECPDDEVEKTAQILVESMENAADVGVPLKVELKIGKNWADMT